MSANDITVFQPATYYDITARDNNPDCVNFEEVFTISEFYSNGGSNCFVQCGRCKQHMEILTATVMDPQPEVV